MVKLVKLSQLIVPASFAAAALLVLAKLRQLKARVVYFNAPDADAAQIVANKFRLAGYDVEIVPASPQTANTELLRGADVVVTIGGPVVNPFYNSVTSEAPDQINRTVVKRRGNLFVVAGYDKADTLRAAKKLSVKTK